jgi:hypothetical protein
MTSARVSELAWKHSSQARNAGKTGFTFRPFAESVDEVLRADDGAFATIIRCVFMANEFIFGSLVAVADDFAVWFFAVWYAFSCVKDV